MKRRLSTLLSGILVCVFCIGIYANPASAADSFADVPSGHAHYEAIELLSQNGIINGYPDGTFKPESNITRAEFTAMLCRALGQEEEALAQPFAQTFTDVAEAHWAAPVILFAYRADIINGMGDGTFQPERNITYEQAIKMVVAALGQSQAAESRGGYPHGYLAIGREIGLAENASGQVGAAANRGLIAQIIFNGGFVEAQPPQTLGDIALNQSESAIQAEWTATRTLDTSAGKWQFYKEDTHFWMLYFSGDKLQYAYTTDLSETENGTVYTDTNDNERPYAVSIGTLPQDNAETTEQLIFEITNAFRALHGLEPLSWHKVLGQVARAHCEDMTARNFFDHENPEGKSPGDRMTAAGYTWSTYAENINHGYSNAVAAVHGWINSAGHRRNILTTSCTEIGVGWAASSGTYGTQVFGAQRNNAQNAATDAENGASSAETDGAQPVGLDVSAVPAAWFSSLPTDTHLAGTSLQDLADGDVVVVFGRILCGNTTYYLTTLQQKIADLNLQGLINVVFYDVDQPLADLQSYAAEQEGLTIYAGGNSKMWELLRACDVGNSVSFPAVAYVHKGTVVNVATGFQNGAAIEAALWDLRDN